MVSSVDEDTDGGPVCCDVMLVDDDNTMVKDIVTLSLPSNREEVDI
jgi:hypothetical protein